jgi:hypothetical protein
MSERRHVALSAKSRMGASLVQAGQHDGVPLRIAGWQQILIRTV